MKISFVVHEIWFFEIFNSIFELRLYSTCVRVHMAHITSVQWGIHMSQWSIEFFALTLDFVIKTHFASTWHDWIFSRIWAILVARISLVINRFSRENDYPLLSIDKVLSMSSCHRNSICHNNRVVLSPMDHVHYVWTTCLWLIFNIYMYM